MSAEKSKEQIVAASYWEHFKYAKELALMGHPKASHMHSVANDILKQWNDIKVEGIEKINENV